MPTNLITEPTIEPMTLQEAKDHLRVDHVDDDSVIEPNIKAVREHSETFLGRALITQTWDLFINNFPPYGSWLEIPFPPLQSVTTIKYIDENGTQQTLSSSIYTVDINAEMGRVFLAYDQVWPTVRPILNAIEIRFVAGYGANAEDIPESIRQGIKMLLGHLYENRETTLVGTIIASVPQAYEWLLWPYRVVRF